MARPSALAITYSRRARADLFDIADYTVQKWGKEQASHYLGDIQDSCVRLARHPLLGRACNLLAQGLRRIEVGQHVIFYRLQSDRILVARILHRSMLPELHSMHD